MNADVLDLKPSLESARRAFDHWRGSRSRRGRTPLELQRRAVDLLEHHCSFHVCRALGINAVALKRWTETLGRIDARHEPHVDGEAVAGFITLPGIDETPSTTSRADTIDSLIIELPNETVIRVRGAFTLEDLFSAATGVAGISARDSR